MAVKFQDYYKILGLDRTATDKEIRQAYRKLAREYHPDLQPKEKQKEAEKKFKLINEAYEVLGDPEKRKKYDRLGANWQHGDDFTAYRDYQQRAYRPGTERGFEEYPGGFSFHFGGEEHDFSDFFETFFGGGFRGDIFRNSRRGRPRKGADLRAEMEVTLEEIYFEKEKHLQFSIQETCSRCGGAGYFNDTNICPLCEGVGYVPGVKALKLKVPRDARDSTKIRLKGQGGKSDSGGESGDLYLKIKVLPHPLFTLKDDNLEAELTVLPWQAVLGDKVSAPTLDGTIRVTVPPRTKSGHKLRLRGKGMPGKNDRRGDLILKVIIDIPREIKPEEEELYRKLAALQN